MRATPRPGASLRDLLPEDEPRLALARGAPRRGSATNGKAGAPLLVVEKLVKEYPRKGLAGGFGKMFQRKPAPEPEIFRAVDGISFAVNRGESVGLVGESGCGKSTTSTMVMRLIDKTDGVIMFDGEDIGAIPAKQFARLPMRKRIQMVFQDPTDSLNPRFTAARAIADPILRLGDVKGGDAVRARCEALARQVGLPVELLDRFPHQLSGGQKARVGIARAIALNPDLVILDEPTAALDVSVQAVVLNLLQDLKDSLGMSYLFVSHDLNVVRLLCDRVIVMQARNASSSRVRPSRCFSRPRRNILATSSPRFPIRHSRDGCHPMRRPKTGPCRHCRDCTDLAGRMKERSPRDKKTRSRGCNDEASQGAAQIENLTRPRDQIRAPSPRAPKPYAPRACARRRRAPGLPAPKARRRRLSCSISSSRPPHTRSLSRSSPHGKAPSKPTST